MSLTVFNKDGLELVINTDNGEAFATQAGYSRMSGKDRTTIVKRCKGCESNVIKSAEVLTPGGLQGVVLIPAKLVFEWLMKDNPELALKMGEAGATVYLHQLAGFKVSSTATQPEPQVNSRDSFLLEVMKLGMEAAKLTNDDRATLLYSSHLQNLTSRISAQERTNVPALPEPVWLTISEVLERQGYPMSRKDIQDSLGQIGKRVKASYLLETGEEPRIVPKAVGTNHRSQNIKLYPEDYFPRIIEVATDYWLNKEILI